MTALEIDQLTDAEGKKHDWRKDLIETLAKTQKPDGSWSNENKRWLEQDPKLVTAYVLISLGYVSTDAASTAMLLQVFPQHGA